MEPEHHPIPRARAGPGPPVSCYAGKEHPELARRDDELFLSYVCNADPRKVESDPDLYLPGS